MAGTSNDTTFIDPANSGFPAYLDFNNLRSNAINYLGPITGKYWTDYNVHDPGITTLEVLMYAIMDLGYRTNLPIGSLLASGNSGKTDSNFFTAAQVFGCNPTTILDYRKLLMDIDEVRNAWLEPDRSELNGLYTIYLELEKDQSDFTRSVEWEKYQRTIRHKVKATLHAHRNLCEDFNHIVILKKTSIGINADIEVFPGTSISDAYQSLIRALYAFFSPVPTFYTLGQLTAMDVSMDTIFEGRPYTGRPSHGFLLDADMPVRPAGEISIYRSAVFQVMVGISGIKTIRSLQLLDGQQQPLKTGGGEWVFNFPADSIPAFSLDASSFRWFQNGQQLSINLRSYNNTLQLNALHSGKVIYPAGPPALDAAVPNQPPLNGLDQYYSIQNDYPQVYGIGPGGLPPTASTLRQSQALQFKGYLLFFDQLLADYLAQLNNIRQLFSLSAPQGGSGITYFAGDLSSVPGLTGPNSLLRFPPPSAATPGAATTSPAAPLDTALMFPVSAKDWNELIANKRPNPCNPATPTATTAPLTVPTAKVAALRPYSFRSAAERNTALATLTVLFSSDILQVQTVLQDNGKWLYYISGVNSHFVLISHHCFSNQAGATGEAATVLYTGANKDNYDLVSLGEISSYSFSLAQTTASYQTYLQSILEDPQEYTQRRTDFLTHLMSRFAESFTDYALLEAGFAGDTRIADRQVDLMQRFMAEWPVLSAGRGQAFDYRLDGWNSPNTSGLEKRFKAYCGIADWRRHFLCNFEVHRLEERFHIFLGLAKENLFGCAEPLTEKEAIPAISSLFTNLAARDNYHIVQAEGTYHLEIVFYGILIACSSRTWPDETSALAAAATLCRMWQLAPVKGDTHVSEYQYRPQLLDHRDRVVRTGITGLSSESEAYDYGMSLVGGINDATIWTEELNIVIGDLYPNLSPELPANQVIDRSGFKIYTRQDVLGPGKSHRWSFELLDDGNNFRFRSIMDYESEDEASVAGFQLLHFLTDTRFYHIRKRSAEWYTLVIRVGDVEWAEGEPGCDNEPLAREHVLLISLQARQRLFFLRIISRPFRWKFNFYLGIPGRGSMLFESIESFESQQDSLDAARAFHHAGADLAWREESDEIFLEAILPDGLPLLCRLSDLTRPSSGSEPVLSTLQFLLHAKRDIYRFSAADGQLLHQMMTPDAASKEGTYVYRLVDKDHPRAFHPPHPHTNKTEAESLRDHLILRGREGYSFLEICLGGDNVHYSSTRSKYYYQLRCRNDYFEKRGIPGLRDEIVLFESVTGYDDEAKAQSAFQQNYLTILGKARNPHNYGDDKYISLNDHPDINKATVLVPAHTRDAIRNAALDLVEELTRAARSYPIRLADTDHQSSSPKYKFVLDREGHTDWESAIDYPSAADAHVAFDFFLLLLNFPGNYFVDYDWPECRYRVGIREVLAESTHRFHDEGAAWGPKGVEKFIGVAQTSDGLHLDMRRDCTYSYFAACPNHRATHPCQYESAAQRDRAMAALIKEALPLTADAWISGHTLESTNPLTHHFELLDLKGHPLARVPMPIPRSADAILDRILDIADAIWSGRRPEQFGSDLQLIVSTGNDEFAITPAAHVSETEWMNRLLDFVTYFPVTRERTIKSARTLTTYHLEIKLPGFADPPAPAPSPKDCGCPPANEGDPSCCYLAWKSDSTFSNASEAWKAWLSLLPLLTSKDNYRPIFAQEIGCYGIELYQSHSILARNPQPYSYPDMAIQSLGRARECINAEGLDVVEHLLLRPQLGAAIPVCPTTDPCLSIWADQPSTDAAGEPVFPFYPGADPYSFTMTVALPAWPARFRKQENRVMLEAVLQRETPAHILPRILWLTPRDMCRFEYLYSGWIDTLSRDAHGKDPCHHFSASAFIEFLYEHPIGCLSDNTECSDDPVASETSPDAEWLRQIHRLYCWKDTKCAEPAPELAPQPEPEPRLNPMSTESIEIILEERIEIILDSPFPEPEPGHRTEPAPPADRFQPAPELPTDPAPADPAPADPRLIRRLQSARRTRYEQTIAEWRQLSGEEKLADNIGVFLLDPLPSMKRLEDLMKEIMKVKGRRSAKAKQRNALAGIAISIYFDRISMEADNEDRWTHLRETITKLDIYIADPEAFHQQWRPDEMQQLAPKLDTVRIRQFIQELQPPKK